MGSCDELEYEQVPGSRTALSLAALPLPELPWDGYEDQLQALLKWPGLENLEAVSLHGAPCEAAEQLAKRVPVAFPV